jgi:hypothetical protein
MPPRWLLFVDGGFSPNSREMLDFREWDAPAVLLPLTDCCWELRSTRRMPPCRGRSAVDHPASQRTQSPHFAEAWLKSPTSKVKTSYSNLVRPKGDTGY